LQNVDDRGYVFVTEAADCQIVSKLTDSIGTTTAVAVPDTPLAGRRRMYIKNTSTSSQNVFIGGADVTTGNGYKLGVNDEIVLDITDDIIVYAVASAADGQVNSLELA
jgi:hypothetical protein